MNGSCKEELKAFLRPKLGNLRLGGAFLLATIVTGFVVSDPFGIVAIGLGLSALVSWRDAVDLIRWLRFLADLETHADADTLLKDFDQGVPIIETLRLGEKYVAGRHGAIMYSYEDIVRMYEYIHRTNSAVDAQEIRIVDRKGKTHTLCHLPLHTSHQDVASVYLVMKGKNDKIEFSRKK